MARAFEPERQALLKALPDSDLSAAQIVSEARRALDRAGQSFATTTPDPNLQKSGLWLIEMVKAGAGVLDQGTGAEIVWHEVPAKAKPAIGLNTIIFYGAAALLGILAVMESSRTGLMTAVILAGLRFFSGETLNTIKQRLPFFRAPKALEDQSGRAVKAEARITANTQGFIDALSNALRTADHILVRLAEPQLETHWRDDKRLMSLVQSLLEAENAHDGDFALKLIGQELSTVLAAEGVEQITYSKETEDLFDVMPGIGLDAPKLAAPALMVDGELIRRGTVWGADNG